MHSARLRCIEGAQSWLFLFEWILIDHANMSVPCELGLKLFVDCQFRALLRSVERVSFIETRTVLILTGRGGMYCVRIDPTQYSPYVEAMRRHVSLDFVE